MRSKAASAYETMLAIPGVDCEVSLRSQHISVSSPNAAGGARLGSQLSARGYLKQVERFAFQKRQGTVLCLVPPPVPLHLIPGLCPDPPLVGEAGKQHLAAFYLQGAPCHSVKGCPDADASSVLSLDSIPAPRNTAGLPERRTVPSFHRNRANYGGKHVAFATNKSDSRWSRAATPFERTV